MSAPFEVIAAPFTVWLAPVATVFPLIDVAPAVAWVQLGTSGPLNYKRDGITIDHTKEIVKWRSLGDLGTRKVFITSFDCTVRLVLADVSLEQYSIAVNSNTVTTVPPGGEAGYRKLGLSPNFQVTEKALLLRGPSPYDETLYMQYELPRVVEAGSPQPVYQLGEPAGLALEFHALVDTSQPEDERTGRLIASDLPAIS